MRVEKERHARQTLNCWIEMTKDSDKILYSLSWKSTDLMEFLFIVDSHLLYLGLIYIFVM
jgi:hypothetical protein